MGVVFFLLFALPILIAGPVYFIWSLVRYNKAKENNENMHFPKLHLTISSVAAAVSAVIILYIRLVLLGAIMVIIEEWDQIAPLFK